MYSLLRSLAVALTLTLFAPLALACSITASGKCGGDECASGESCKKTDEFTCKCVKDKPQTDKVEKPAEKPATEPTKK